MKGRLEFKGQYHKNVDQSGEIELRPNKNSRSRQFRYGFQRFPLRFRSKVNSSGCQASREELRERISHS